VVQEREAEEAGRAEAEKNSAAAAKLKAELLASDPPEDRRRRILACEFGLEHVGGREVGHPQSHSIRDDGLEKNSAAAAKLKAELLASDPPEEDASPRGTKRTASRLRVRP
jgi:hypothetical protein